MSERHRSLWARLGLVLLNLPLPGLGLLRLGYWRYALPFLAAPPAAYLLLIVYYAATPELTFSGYAVSSALILGFLVAVIVSSLFVTWRWSRERRGDAPWWSRWYGLILAYAATISLLLVFATAAHSFYKPYHLPGQGMEPTLAKNDRMIAAMGPVHDLKRGEIILFRVNDSIYVQRVAALPGDLIAMRGGIVVLNGRPIAQRALGAEIARGPYGPMEVRRLAERFPGEPKPHSIYDFGPDRVDDMPEQRVAPGHVFVLGDNRDRSADSRVPQADMGVEQLPIDRIVGRALFVSWGTNGRRGVDLR